jgi:hypothetical protein
MQGKSLRGIQRVFFRLASEISEFNGFGVLMVAWEDALSGFLVGDSSSMQTASTPHRQLRAAV